MSAATRVRAQADEALIAHVEAGDDVLEQLKRDDLAVEVVAEMLVRHWLADPASVNLPALVAAARRLAWSARARRRDAPRRSPSDALPRQRESGVFCLLRVAGRHPDYLARVAGGGFDDPAGEFAGQLRSVS